MTKSYEHTLYEFTEVAKSSFASQQYFEEYKWKNVQVSNGVCTPGCDLGNSTNPGNDNPLMTVSCGTAHPAQGICVQYEWV